MLPAYEPVYNLHALHIPDLLSLICDLLDRNDWFSLMRTSKGTFHAIAPQVWREVEAQVLMDLVVEDQSKNESTGVNFSRFDVYAPFVRQLRVYGRTARYLQGKRRSACVSRARHGALVPNVVSITLLTSDLHNDSDALFWLEIFLTPSLRQIHIHPISKRYSAWVSYPATFALLERIKKHAFAVEKLDFYPLDIERTNKADTSTNMIWPPCAQPDIGVLTQLRRISTSIGLLDRCGLLSLGALPRLQFLSVDGCEERSIVLDFSLAENSFPSLTHLTLVEAGTDNVPKFLSMKQLAQGLTSLKVIQRMDYIGNAAEPNAEGQWLSQTLPQLLENTSRLKSFYFDATGQGIRTAGYNRYYSDRHFSVEPLPLFQAMSIKPLHQVTLLGISFLGEDCLASIASVFPYLETLRVPEYSVDSTSLRWFAKIPNLRYLSLGNLHFAEIPEVWEKPTGPLQKFEIKESTGINSSMPPAAKVARYLASLWPELRCITQLTGYHAWWFMDDVGDELARIRIENSGEHV